MSFKKFAGWASGAQTVWGFMPLAWQAPITAVLTAMTAWFGFQAGGIFYALVGGSVVCCCAVLIGYHLMMARRSGSVFEQISIRQVGASELGIKKRMVDGEPVFTATHFAPNCIVKNHSERIVYVKLKREFHSLGGKVNEAAAVGDQLLIIAAQSEQEITFATLPDADFEKGVSLKGRLDLEFVYGGSSKNLEHKFCYLGEIQMGLRMKADSEQGEANIKCTVLKLSHETE